jgi:hypothetical protein
MPPRGKEYVAEDGLLVTGVDADTGSPLYEGLTLESIAQIALGAPEPLSSDLYAKKRRKDRGQGRGAVDGVDTANLAQAGWCVVFAAGFDPEVDKKLKPLLDLRKDQAGKLFRRVEYSKPDGKRDFLKNCGAAETGPANPAQLPYYLLLVGGPEDIPFTVQYELAVQYAVGRIYFGKDLERYEAYAKAVVAAETGLVTVDPCAAFLGTETDTTTQESSSQLVQPLAETFAKTQAAWDVEYLIGESAYKSDLKNLLTRPKAPAMLMTASHGVAYPCGDDRQVPYQGSLILQDWEGRGRVETGMCFSADDVDGLNTSGMISIHFACFSGATPKDNQFFGYTPSKAGLDKYLAPEPFLSALPSRLLANGTLAAVGHVDTAFSTTFRQGASTAVFQDVLGKLAKGGRIGEAMDDFSLRHAELSVGLTVTLDNEQRSKLEVREDLAWRWLQNNDARNYFVTGDPAVKLPLAFSKAEQQARLTKRIGDLEAELAALRQQLSAL